MALSALWLHQESSLPERMIAIRNLSHAYPVRRGKPRSALAGITLTIAPGTFFVLTGPNGGGKSTLFRILCGSALPSGGEVHIDGQDIFRHPQAVRRLLGVVFQHPALDKHLTVMENFRIHADLYGVPRGLFQDRLQEAIAWTGLEERLADNVSTLSGGQARRVELVKALLHRPRILLMDEPTSGLDPGARRLFLDIVLRLRRERGTTILMTSHLFAEAEQADQVGILKGGELLAAGSPDELRSRLGGEMVVIETRDPQQAEKLGQELSQKPAITVQRRESELRVEGIDAATLEQLVSRRREGFQTLAIKRPTLEDLFIHLTSHQLGAGP